MVCLCVCVLCLETLRDNCVPWVENLKGLYLDSGDEGGAMDIDGDDLSGFIVHKKDERKKDELLLGSVGAEQPTVLRSQNVPVHLPAVVRKIAATEEIKETETEADTPNVVVGSKRSRETTHEVPETTEIQIENINEQEELKDRPAKRQKP